MSAEPPPTYSQNFEHSAAYTEPQILIVPHSNGVGFQKGYLGADDEHAAVEGELQVKGVSDRPWGRVTMTLRTTEKANGSEVELASTEITLYSALSDSSVNEPLPSVYPFSIPLQPDTPQCVHTPWSSISHTLTATLHPVDPSQSSISHSVAVHTRRYTSHSYVLSIIPETKSFDDPTHVEVQVPRTTFRSGEPIPLYLTIPPPRRELVLDEGIRLRNVRAEFIRIVSTHKGAATAQPVNQTPQASSSATVSKTASGPTSESLDMRSHIGVPGGGEVIAVSGATARLHPSDTVRLRLVLHPRTNESYPTSDSPSSDLASDTVVESGSECATISQTTLFHSVSFQICVHVTFMHMSSHTERVCTITIPVVIVPLAATLPEVEDDIETAYHKKHDRPPTHTNRLEESDVPGYTGGGAGPSFSHAPPPFEEREAPPPFFPSEPEASSSRLPTFLESEAEIYVPEPDDAPQEPEPPELVFEGEGSLYGFTTDEQFDGYQVFSEQERSGTPPPTLEMATLDPDVTSLATMDRSAALSALELAFEQHHDANSDEDHPPPPPPPMDDPSDPPPSIDSDFRAPGSHHVSSSPPP
ncbi:hypothetical protein BDY19DRAFT_864915, partial [Irpex rosettiformis]